MHTPDGGAARAYVAILLSRSSSDRPGYRPLWQEDVVLLRAGSAEEARERARARGERAGTTFRNEYGDTITWTFQQLVDVVEVLDEDLSGEADLCSRTFRDYDAYVRFEPLLGGEPQ